MESTIFYRSGSAPQPIGEHSALITDHWMMTWRRALQPRLRKSIIRLVGSGRPTLGASPARRPPSTVCRRPTGWARPRRQAGSQRKGQRRRGRVVVRRCCRIVSSADLRRLPNITADSSLISWFLSFSLSYKLTVSFRWSGTGHPQRQSPFICVAVVVFEDFNPTKCASIGADVLGASGLEQPWGKLCWC